MNFPVDGRVVIIDDKFHEAFPLIRMLSQKRVATTSIEMNVPNTYLKKKNWMNLREN